MRTLRTFCTALLLTALCATVASAAGVGYVAQIKGQAMVRKSGKGDWINLNLKDDVNNGDRVRTLGGARIRLTFTDNSVMTLGENSEMTIERHNVTQTRRVSRFRLWTGRVRALVTKLFRGGESSYQVETGTAVAGIRGTEFIVTTDGQQSTEIIVLEGEVEVESIFDRAKGPISLKSGEVSTILSGQRPSPPSPVPDLRLNQAKDATDISSTPKPDGGPEGAELEMPEPEIEDVQTRGGKREERGNLPPNNNLVPDGSGKTAPPAPMDPTQMPGADSLGGPGSGPPNPQTPVDVTPQIP